MLRPIRALLILPSIEKVCETQLEPLVENYCGLLETRGISFVGLPNGEGFYVDEALLDHMTTETRFWMLPGMACPLPGCALLVGPADEDGGDRGTSLILKTLRTVLRFCGFEEAMRYPRLAQFQARVLHQQPGSTRIR